MLNYKCSFYGYYPKSPILSVVWPLNTHTELLPHEGVDRGNEEKQL